MKTKSLKPQDLKVSQELESRGLTPFSIQVLMATRQIPAGETRTYSEIAQLIGRPGSMRAVGSALAKNPIPGSKSNQVPCHRVIHKSGKIEGFQGSLDPKSASNQKKRRLLKQEGVL